MDKYFLETKDHKILEVNGVAFNTYYYKNMVRVNVLPELKNDSSKTFLTRLKNRQKVNSIKLKYYFQYMELGFPYYISLNRVKQIWYEKW